MDHTNRPRPLLRRPWFVAVLVLSGAVVTLGVAGWLAMKNIGGYLASMPSVLPVDVPKMYAVAKARLDLCTDDACRYYALGDVAMWSVDTGQLDEAAGYASELLKLNEAMGRNWNTGNAIHKAHSALGRVAIKRGDVATGEHELALVATSKGSPQMNSFGPNMALPRDLLQTGQPSAKAAVLAYLEYLPTFWTMDRGAIAVWRADVERGETPNFGANLLY